MTRVIEDLQGHTIVCGWGRVGQAISNTLRSEGRDLGGTTILAVRERSGRFVHHPEPNTTASEGDVLIALGTATEQAELRALAEP